MDLQTLAAIASLISAVAVLATLVNLTLALRQTNRNQRATIHQGMAYHLTELLLRASEQDMAAVLARARIDAPDLSPVELTQLWNFLRVCMIACHDGYLHHQVSLYSDRYFEMQERHMVFILSIPAMRKLWEVMKPSFESEFVDYVTRAVATSPPRRLDLSAAIGGGSQIQGP